MLMRTTSCMGQTDYLKGQDFIISLPEQKFWV